MTGACCGSAGECIASPRTANDGAPVCPLILLRVVVSLRARSLLWTAIRVVFRE